MLLTKEVSEGQVTRESDYFRDALKLPEKTNFLKLAEANYNKLRSDRRTLEARVRAMTIALHRPTEMPPAPARDEDANITPDDLKAIDAKITALAEPTKTASIERERRRLEFGVKARAALSGEVTKYSEALHGQLAVLEDLARCAIALETEAVGAGIEVQKVISRSVQVTEMVRQIRVMLRS